MQLMQLPHFLIGTHEASPAAAFATECSLLKTQFALAANWRNANTPEKNSPLEISCSHFVNILIARGWNLVLEFFAQQRKF